MVVHPKRPEWGEGVVKQASRAVQGGVVGQRLVVSFKNNGITTINTAVVPLLARNEAMALTQSSTGQGWLADLEAKQRTGGRAGSDLSRLPDVLTDPFRSELARVQATLDTYRFGGQHATPRGLLEWAIGQTGMNDPLSEYSRHDLEQAWSRFAYERDLHLADLVRQVIRLGQTAALQEMLSKPSLADAGRQALGRLLRR